MTPPSEAEIEAQRQDALKRIRETMLGVANFDEAGFGPGTLACHEGLHAASIVLDMVERQLMDHPAVVVNKDWYAQAAAAHHHLFELYQAIGGAHLPDPDPGGEDVS